MIYLLLHSQFSNMFASVEFWTTNQMLSFFLDLIVNLMFLQYFLKVIHIDLRSLNLVVLGWQKISFILFLSWYCLHKIYVWYHSGYRSCYIDIKTDSSMSLKYFWTTEFPKIYWFFRSVRVLQLCSLCSRLLWLFVAFCEYHINIMNFRIVFLFL